jgi:hypothetical protein
MPNGMMFHILDDFLILAPTFDMCKRYLQEFLAFFRCKNAEASDKHLSSLSLGKRATFCTVFNSIPRKVKQVEGPIVFSGAMGIPILSHIVKNSSKYLLHISNVGAKRIIGRQSSWPFSTQTL